MKKHASIPINEALDSHCETFSMASGRVHLFLLNSGACVLALATMFAFFPVSSSADVAASPQTIVAPSFPYAKVPGDAQRYWAALSGSTLRETMQAWAKTVGWTIVWDTDTNYRLRASASFSGSFVNAVTELVDSIHVNNPELTVTMYLGNRVVHVQTLLNETR